MHDWHMPDESNGATLAARRLAAAGGILLIMQSLSQRGGERVAILLANGFAAADIPVRIALMRDCGDAENELLALLHEGVLVASAGSPLQVPGRKYFERLRAVPFIRRQIRSFAPAVVLCTVNSLALATALSRGRTRALPAFALKLTNSLAAPDMAAPKRIYRHKSFEFIFSRFDLVLTTSEAERQDELGSSAPFPILMSRRRCFPVRRRSVRRQPEYWRPGGWCARNGSIISCTRSPV